MGQQSGLEPQQDRTAGGTRPIKQALSGMKQTTRDFHNALAAWKKSLPPVSPDFPDSVKFQPGLKDLDTGMIGKSGVFFNQGTVMYELYRSRQANERVLGYGRLLCQEVGALIALLDDTQGIIYGKPSLTKSLRVVFPGPYDLSAYAERVKLEAKVEIIPTEKDKRTDIYGNILVFDSNGKLIARSDTHFVQNANIRKLQNRPSMSETDIAVRNDRIWEKLQPFLLTPGLTWRDGGKFSFALRLPFNISSLPYPSYWKPLNGEHVSVKDILESEMLKGRVLFDHISYSDDVCRGVIKSGLSAEGPISFVHGGCAAGSWLHILSHATDLSNLRAFTIHFKRPIQLETAVACEWVRWGACDWRGTARDLKGDVLQELFAEFTVGSKVSSLTMNAAL